MRSPRFEQLESRMLLSITGSISGHVRTDDGSGMGGVAVYLEPQNASYQLDGPQIALTAYDGSYSFDDVPPGTYDVELLSSQNGVEHDYFAPVAISGVYDDIVIEVGESETNINFVCGTGDPTIDVFFLGDDTGSHASVNGDYFGQISNVVDTLTQVPGINWRFGIGRFDDFPEYPDHPANSEFADSRDVPFTLNMAMMDSDNLNFDATLQTAIGATTDGEGGDTPESLNEALFQSVNSAGFLNYGLNFGYAPPIILAGTDAGTSYQKASPEVDTIYGVEDVLLVEFNADSKFLDELRDQTPNQAGATIQDTVDILNLAGARVIGLKSDPYGGTGVGIADTGGPFPAYAKATGTINYSNNPLTYTFEGTQYSIDPGEPVVIHTQADNLSTILTEAILNQVELTPELAFIRVFAEPEVGALDVSDVEIGLVPMGLLDLYLTGNIDVPTLSTNTGGHVDFNGMLTQEYAVFVNGAVTQTRVYTQASGDVVIPELYEADFIQTGANSWKTGVYCEWSGPVPDTLNTMVNTPISISGITDNDGGAIIANTITDIGQPNYGTIVNGYYIPPTDWEGEATFTYTARKSEGGQTETGTTTVTIHVGGPKISSATVGRNGSSYTFVTDSDSDEQLYTVPISSINSVTLTFNQDDIDFDASDLRVVNATTSHTYWATSATENSVSSGSSVTWTFSSNLYNGEMYLWLNDTCELGSVPIDGEWESPLYFGDNIDNSEFYDGAQFVGSGNGLAGSDFEFAFTILSGDVNRNGTVDGSDVTIIAGNLNSPGTWTDGDINGDGMVNGSDVTLLAYNWQVSYWQQPVAATSSFSLTSSSLSSQSSLSEIDLLFSEYGLDDSNAYKDWLALDNKKFDRFLDKLFDLF